MNSTVIFRKPGRPAADAYRLADQVAAERQVMMVVDDHPVIRQCMQLTAERTANTEIETYGNPLEALNAFQSNPDRYRVVITDYHMPEMTGAELIRGIQAIQPDQSIVLMSAAANANEVEIATGRHCRFLRKPFGWAELTEQIEQLESARINRRF